MTTDRDQLTFDNPVTRYARVEPPLQHQPEPGVQADMTPIPDLGEKTYRGLAPHRPEGPHHGRRLGHRRRRRDRVRARGRRRRDRAPAGRAARRRSRPGAGPGCRPNRRLDRDRHHRPRACRALVAEAVEALGGLDIVVNNAGKQIMVEKVDDLSDEQFEATFRTNVFAPFWITKAALPHLPEGATIINTASLEAYVPAPTGWTTPPRRPRSTTCRRASPSSSRPAASGSTSSPRAHVVGAPGERRRLGRPDGALRRREHVPARGAARRDRARVRVPRLAESSYVSGETLNVNGGMVTP